MLDLCVNGIIRLFFIIVKFGWNHLGWTFTLFVGLFLLLWIAKKLGVNILELGPGEYLLFFPILLILMFMGLMIGTYIATLWSGYEFCQIIEEMSTWLL